MDAPTDPLKAGSAAPHPHGPQYCQIFYMFVNLVCVKQEILVFFTCISLTADEVSWSLAFPVALEWKNSPSHMCRTVVLQSSWPRSHSFTWQFSFLSHSMHRRPQVAEGRRRGQERLLQLCARIPSRPFISQYQDQVPRPCAP